MVYAAWSRPTQSAQPGVQPDKGSKCVKTNSADRLPFFAIANELIDIAVIPAKVEKTANICIILYVSAIRFSHVNEISVLTSSIWSFALASATIALQPKVIARKIKKT